MSNSEERWYWTLQGFAYPDSESALADALPSSFTLTVPSVVGFSVGDFAFALSDNSGGVSLLLTHIPSVTQVSIDIKPGSDPNSINLCSNGAVPIAILGSDTFYVSEVNTETLRFAEAAIKVVGKKDPHTLCSYEDVNGDTIEDLVCHYVTADIAGIDGESTSATVNGELLPEFGGTPFEGSDSVNIVKDTCN